MPRPGAGFSVTFSVENLEHWTRRIDGADKVIFRETKLSLTSMGSHLKPLIQSKTPVDRGKLQRGISFKVEHRGSAIWELILDVFDEQARKYALYVERGTRPHWPPIAAITGWAERHGIPPFLVARAIAKHGTIKRFGRPGPAGAEMFGKTLDQEEGWIRGEQARLHENIVKGIVSG